jgi:hypothetical protein
MIQLTDSEAALKTVICILCYVMRGCVRACVQVKRRHLLLFSIYFFFVNPLLFASCTNTFSKWCKITRGMKRSAQ